MRNPAPVLAPLALVLLSACSTEFRDSLDGTLQRRINTMNDCFPDLFEKADHLLEIAELWRMDTAAPIPDPPGLAWSQQGDGSLLVTLTEGACTYTMTIRFFSPVGVEQTDLVLGGAASLSEAIDDAATELRNRFAGNEPFMVGDWILAATGVSGSGALTGIIGGSMNQNELERINTSSATVVGGEPPGADATVTLPDCSLVFRTEGTGLVTDDAPTQEYPEGTITGTIDGAETLDFTIVFDRTSRATITVDDVGGTFTIDLDTYDLDYAP